MKKRTGFLILFLVAGSIEISNLLRHFYMVVDLYDYILNDHSSQVHFKKT